MSWTQNYDPFASAWLSPLAAAVPIVLLLALLATGRVSAPLAALAGLLSALFIAIFVFTPPQTASPDSGGLLAWSTTVLASAAYGAALRR